MIVYALAKKTIFFTNNGDLWLAFSDIELISKLIKKGTDFQMLVYPITDMSEEKSAVWRTSIIKSLRFNKKNGFWDVHTVSGSNYRLLV